MFFSGSFVDVMKGHPRRNSRLSVQNRDGFAESTIILEHLPTLNLSTASHHAYLEEMAMQELLRV